MTFSQEVEKEFVKITIEARQESDIKTAESMAIVFNIIKPQILSFITTKLKQLKDQIIAEGEKMIKNSPDSQSIIHLLDGTPVPKGNNYEDCINNLAVNKFISIIKSV